MPPLRVATVFGTRPEAIKMAPVIQALADCPDTQPIVVSSGQHRELLPQALSVFGLSAEYDLGAMVSGQDLAALTGRIVDACHRLLREITVDVVLVHGDTTTTLAAALAAFYAKTPIGHVEAGLRTGDLGSPFPEEMNRVLADRLSEVHFAPTARCAANLAAEGIRSDGVYVTGNTGIDALLGVAGPRRRRAGGRRLVLVEAHRRENLGDPMERMAGAVRTAVRRHDDIEVIWSVHPNPLVSRPVRSALEGEARVALLDPPGYAEWAALLAEADLLLTDSGGLQEEAPALGLPLLVMRESTERPEVVDCGAAWLVGSAPDRILAGLDRLLNDEGAYSAMASAGSPFGDGRAASRTVRGLLHHFGRIGARPEPFQGISGELN